MEKLRLKQITAFVLIWAIGMSICGCEGKEKEKNQDDAKLASYKIAEQIDFEYDISDTIVNRNVIYGYGMKYENNSEDYTYELFKYDYDTKDRLDKTLGAEVRNIINICFDEKNQIVVNVKVTEKDFDNEHMEENIGENIEENIKENRESNTLIDAIYVYDINLELVSKNKIDRYADSDITEGEVEGIFSDSTTTVVLYRLSEDEYAVSVEDENGSIIKKIPLEDMQLSGFEKLDSTTFTLLDKKEKTSTIYKLDISEEDPLIKIAELKNYTRLHRMKQTSEKHLTVSMDEYLYICDTDTGNLSKVLKYIDTGIVSNEVNCAFEINTDVYGVVLYDVKNQKSEIDVLMKRDAVKDKKELHLAMLMVDSDIQQKVVAFNQSNEEYRIVIDEYVAPGSYDDDEAYRAALTRFNMDIVSGNGADIVDMGWNVDISNYAGKGALEDLLPYMERDSEINVEDFVESVVNACKIDGKLYVLSSDFSINCLYGPKRLLGENIEWTLQEFIDFVNHLPDGMEVFAKEYRDDLLNKILTYSINEYIDWSSGKCSFASEEFISLLELCNRYPSFEEVYGKDNGEDMPSDETMIRNHQVAMVKSGVGVYPYIYAKQIFGEEVAVKGYPTSEGTGLAVQLNNRAMLAINSKSKYKDVAWEFIRQFYTYDTQSQLNGAYPIRKDILYKNIEEAMNWEVETAPDGTEYYQSVKAGDTVLYLPPPTEEDIERVKDLINQADGMAGNQNRKLYSIIEEEAQPYFLGQKSAEEAADIIQSRISVYVQENS